MIYPIVRTAEREKKFKWIAKVAPDQHFVFVKRKDNKRVDLTDENNLKHRSIAVNVGSFIEAYLIRHGYQNIVSHPDYINAIKLLFMGRIDFLLISKTVFDQAIRQSGYAPELFVQHKAFDKDVYLAANKDTSDEIVSKLIEAYQKVLDGKAK